MRRKHSVEQILDKGMELIRRQGYNNTGIEEILKACGIPKGSFYNFFKSKEDFGVKALNHYVEKQYQFFEQCLSDTSLSPLERIRQFFNQSAVRYIDENFENGCLLGNLTQEMGGISDNIGKAVNGHFNRLTNLIGACIAEGQEIGEIRDDYTASELANYIIDNGYGVLLRMKAERRIDAFHRFDKMTFEFLKKDSERA